MALPKVVSGVYGLEGAEDGAANRTHLTHLGTQTIGCFNVYFQM